MRYVITTLLATLALMAVACGNDNETSSTEPSPNPDPTVTIAATLPAPTVVTLGEKSSEFWALRGYGPLRLPPDSLSSSSTQLGKDMLIDQWTDFLSGVALIDDSTFGAFVHLCSDGSAHGVPGVWVIHNQSTLDTWEVSAFEASDNVPNVEVDGNTVKINFRDGGFVIPVYWAVHEGSIVNVGRTEGGVVGQGIRYSATESLECD